MVSKLKLSHLLYEWMFNTDFCYLELTLFTLNLDKFTSHKDLFKIMLCLINLNFIWWKRYNWKSFSRPIHVGLCGSLTSDVMACGMTLWVSLTAMYTSISLSDVKRLRTFQRVETNPLLVTPSLVCINNLLYSNNVYI